MRARLIDLSCVNRYSRYFHDAQKEQVDKMMQIIYNSRLPVDDNDDGRGYYIHVLCGSDQDKKNCSDDSTLAATNFKPGYTSVSHQAVRLEFRSKTWLERGTAEAMSKSLTNFHR